ncbi:MAG: tRNA (adenosine(37)-N6)-threonylcarbamoyltransferase complex ATPase subunit type 1 TsaE [Patescibacteria group bacterium]
METISQNLIATAEFAAECLKFLNQTSASTEATVVGLSGELGAGKTAFTQAVARALGVRAAVLSPTFVLIKTYPLPKNANWHWRRLVHLDCYRLDQAADLAKLGWAELSADSANLIFVEWPERVAEILPATTTKIIFEIIGEFTRRISFRS